jgi:Ca2+-binding RTX toxin-like protein
MRPPEGSYFALLTSGNRQPKTTTISQPFEASNGDKISGWAFFQTGNWLVDECTIANEDKGQVVIRSDSGTTVATPFEQNINTVPSTRWGGNSEWRYWEYTFTGLTGTGRFQIEARVNTGTSATDLNRMGLDDVKTSTGGPDTTPPETYITSGFGYVNFGVGCKTPSTSATFEFSSNEQGSTFECQLWKDDYPVDAVVQAWADCTSPKSYSNLSRHEQWAVGYRFEVRATDPAGNVDPSPASRLWFIERGTDPPPDTAPSCTKTGTANAETISGTSGDDVICAGGGNDTIKGLGGNDTLKGEDGNDTLIGGVGNDSLDGGPGTDTASYAPSLTAVIASLATNAATGEDSDTFAGTENLLGSSKADSLTGSNTDNRLTGGGANDTLKGGGGNDQVIGSGGADSLFGEDGNDAVNSKDGVNGNDSLDGGSGTDTREKSIVGFP